MKERMERLLEAGRQNQGILENRDLIYLLGAVPQKEEDAGRADEGDL